MNQRNSNQKQDTSFESRRSIESAIGNRSSKEIVQAHNASFSYYDGFEKISEIDSKRMKCEIDRLNALVNTLKDTHKEEENALHYQINTLQKELELIKIEFSETVELLAMVLGNYKDPKIPKVVDQKIMQILEEKQENLKIIMSTALKEAHSRSMPAKFIMPSIDTSELINFDHRDNMIGTGRFQNVESQYFPENIITPNSHYNVIALYDYNPGLSDHLEFAVGDRITVLRQLEDGWWHGELNGITGKFPSNYVLMD